MGCAIRFNRAVAYTWLSLECAHRGTVGFQQRVVQPCEAVKVLQPRKAVQCEASLGDVVQGERCCTANPSRMKPASSTDLSAALAVKEGVRIARKKLSSLLLRLMLEGGSKRFVTAFTLTTRNQWPWCSNPGG
jgi:hypothetical protein